MRYKTHADPKSRSPEEYGYDLIRNNLSESSVADRRLSDLGLTVPDLTLLYGEHRGGKALRRLIAADGVDPDDVLITTGAAGALFHHRHRAARPGGQSRRGAAELRDPIWKRRAPSAAPSRISILLSKRVSRSISIGFPPRSRRRRKIISVTCPHNPTGVMYGEAVLQSLVALARQHDCYLLVDETYRDLSLGERLPLAAALGTHVISVSSLSKAYGVPGIRLGWLITRDRHLQEVFLAAREQISICGSVIDEWIGLQILQNRTSILEDILAGMRARRDPRRRVDRRRGDARMGASAGRRGLFPAHANGPAGGLDAFYERLLGVHGTYVGPGHWFEMPDSYFRLGYGWPSDEQLRAGLEGITKALRG